MNNDGLKLYLTEAQRHSKQYLAELDELRQDLLKNNFKGRDHRAAERVLQIYTALCIGLAKHYLKSMVGHSASDAYQTFSLLKEQGEINTEKLKTWRKIIGMRNGLIHDYLNLDPLILENVIREKHYIELDEFSTIAIQYLHNNA